MAQSDNTVSIIGKVVKGPFVSFVNGDTTKMRVKYQVQVETRKRDNKQTFIPWVRTLGNQAQRDYENIKTGDIVAVHGRIVTRNENKKRFFKLDEEDMTQLVEIDIHDADDINEDEVLILNDRRMVTEIQAQDVRYFSRWLSDLTEEEMNRLLSPKVIEKVIEERERAKSLTEEDEDEN